MGDGQEARRSRRRRTGGKKTRGAARRSGAPYGHSFRRTMSLEHLEDRRMLTTFLVNNLDDAGFGSLRWALDQTNAADDLDEIVFSDAAYNTINGIDHEIDMTSGAYNITQPVRILGPGSRKLAIFQTRSNQRIFNINIGDDDEIFRVEISGVTLVGGNLNGDDDRGGAITSKESLTMVEAVVRQNFAAGGGGGIWIERGNLFLERSAVTNNFAGLVGGGIMIGSDDEDSFASAQLTNSTITGNSAAGASDEYPMGSYGGGVFVRSGVVEIQSCTIVNNNAAVGGGVAAWGAPVPEESMEDPPPPPPDPPGATVTVHSSIVWGNGADDIASVGVTDDDPPLPLLPLIESTGFNIIEVFGAGLTRHADDLAEGTDPDFVSPLGSINLFGDFGGSIDVYMISETSPAIDAGDGELGAYDQRGRHFTRVYDYAGGGSDIGAVERQEGIFVVDELYDEAETEGQSVGIYQIVDASLGIIEILSNPNDIFFPVPGFETPYESLGDFTIREALAYARKNLEPAVIEFLPALVTREFENDPNAQLTPATITLTLGQLTIQQDIDIHGPANFILEIDAAGNDNNPNGQPDGIGTRVLELLAGFTAEISNLTFKGGDINAAVGGAGILSAGNLTLIDCTIKENDIKGNGGGVAIRGGSADIRGTTFKNNTASTNGGGLSVDLNATVVVTNSTFSGNSATGRGAGIVNTNADLTIQFSTITLNTAGTTRGSGVWTLNGANASTEIRGSIISQNAINDVEFATGANAKVVSLGYNLVGAGNAIGAFTVANHDLPGITNPMLEPLLISGGQTETHRPKAGSPIIDAGDPVFDGSAFMPPIDFDQRGPDFVRVFDGDGAGGARIDIGSYELQSSEFIVSTELDENDGNYSFGFLSLREAIKLANDNPLNDTIRFDVALVAANPVFLLSAFTLTIDQSADMRITTPMTIEGPGSGLLTLDGSGVIHPLHPLDGPQRAFTVDNGNAASAINVTITGLTIINTTSGAAGGALLSRENLTLDDMQFIANSTVTNDPLLTGILTPNLHGGAIYQQGASLTINNSILTGNSTDAPSSDGGGLYATGAVVNFFYTTFSGNSTLQGTSRGGGLALKNSTLVATEVTIVGNTTSAGLSDGGGAFIDSSNALFEQSAIGGNRTTGSNSEGGGLYVTGATSQVSVEKDSTVTFNSTAGTQASGGGVYVNGGAVIIGNSALIQNSTAGSTAHGGAAAVANGGTLTLTGTRVQLNTTSGLNSNGGGIANLSGNLTIRDSTLSGNRTLNAQSKGGGIFSDTNLAGTQLTTILNSTISGNTAALRGGGVFNADGNTAIRHSTITNNSTPYLNAGNGVASFGNTATVTTVESSIIAGNVGSGAGTGSDVDFDGAQFLNSFTSQGYNVIGTGNALADFIVTGDKTGIINPFLGPLSNYGGLTQTHSLLDGSPAINAGKPSFNPNAFAPPLSTDQRGVGFARVLGGRIDAGAFESTFTPFSADFDLSGRVDGNDYLIWQRFNGLQVGGTRATGDATGDGKVNGADLAAWRSQFGLSAAEAAVIPAAVGGGSEEPAAAVAASEPNDAESSSSSATFSSVTFSTADAGDASPNYTPLAAAGVPGAVAPARHAYRPGLDRRLAARDAVHAVLGTHVASFPGAAASARRAALELGEHAASDEACDFDGAAEDSVFALLAEGLL